MRPGRTNGQRRLGALVLSAGHQRPPRARALSSLRLFASAALRASSARSASVRLVTTGASQSGACTRSPGCHPGAAPVVERCFRLPALPPVRPHAQSASRTGGRGSRPQRQRCEARGGPKCCTGAAGWSITATPEVVVGASDLPSVEGARKSTARGTTSPPSGRCSRSPGHLASTGRSPVPPGL